MLAYYFAAPLSYLIILKKSLGGTFKQSAAAGLTTAICSTAVCYLVAIGARSRLLEAFVVPTGAMSPTILGAHADLECENCGYAYAVSLSDRTAGRPAQAKVAKCPNCGVELTVKLEEPIVSGDRFVADKTTTAPERWELAVFDTPDEPAVQYVKRAVGLPGEQIEIAGGEIFVNGSIAQKPPNGLAALWLPVHDSVFVPQNVAKDTPRWIPDNEVSVWQQDGSTWIGRNSSNTPAELVFAGEISSWRAYNAVWPGDEFFAVGDIKLVCDVSELSDNAELSIHWAFGTRQISAQITGAGNAALSAGDADADDGADSNPVTAGETGSPWSEAHPLIFAIRDGQAVLMQGDRLLGEIDVRPQTPSDAKRLMDELADPPELKIDLRNGRVQLNRIQLMRDVYYLSPVEIGHGMSDVIQLPLQLGPGEYLMLGDNSSASKDSRFFGPVQAEAINGIARWIYWPLHRAGALD